MISLSDVLHCLVVDYPGLEWDSDFNCHNEGIYFQVVQHSETGRLAFRYRVLDFDITQHWGLCLSEHYHPYCSQGGWWIYELIDHLQRFAVSFERFLTKVMFTINYAQQTYHPDLKK
jgi:hypothetical protein